MKRNLDDDQQLVIEALTEGTYKKMKPLNSPSASNYMTHSGISFTWLHGMGDGKTVKVQDVVQPEWFAKHVRRYLEQL